MATRVRVFDETTSGEKSEAVELEFLTERVTVRELIRSRVHQEVKDYNAANGEVFRGLVQPEDSERVLNGFRLAQRRAVDWQVQYERALEAFEQNGFLVLVDEAQVDGLDQEVVVAPSTTVSFLRLVPLVGG